MTIDDVIQSLTERPENWELHRETQMMRQDYFWRKARQNNKKHFSVRVYISNERPCTAASLQVAEGNEITPVALTAEEKTRLTAAVNLALTQRQNSGRDKSLSLLVSLEFHP